jgi:tryptophan synthase alpha chain
MRIAPTFAALSAKKEKALVAFLTAGDPDPAVSLAACRAVLRGGADLLELGVPFSDPMADGPAIQRSSERALRAGMSLRKVLDLCAALRREFTAPIILFGYYNPFLAFGTVALCEQAAAAGADGFLVVDLPPEEAAEIHGPARAHGLDLIYLCAPTSTAARIARVRQSASGFVYYVSMTGVTGKNLGAIDEIRENVRRLQGELSLPVCVGFGITTADEARAVAAVADGVVVGSAFVRLCEEHAGDVPRLTTEVESFTRSLKDAVRQGGA